MRTPNYFIIGAPKCGTTALSEYLRSHPQAFMSDPKEPHYFADDIPNYKIVTKMDDYLGLFAAAKPEHKAIGEASVFYLYSQVAVTNILKEYPHAKLLVMLRNPVDVAVSMHAQALYNGGEIINSFEDAWLASRDRQAGRNIPRRCQDVKTLFYDQIALLGAQLERLLNTAPRQQVRWWFYDDLTSDPRKMYVEVLDFLGLDDDRRTDFDRFNERKERPYKPLTWFTQRTPTVLVKAAMATKDRLGLERLGILDFLRDLNTRPAKGSQLPDSVVQTMQDFFHRDIDLLARLTGRNLDHWKRREENLNTHDGSGRQIRTTV